MSSWVSRASTVWVNAVFSAWLNAPDAILPSSEFTLSWILVTWASTTLLMSLSKAVA